MSTSTSQRPLIVDIREASRMLSISERKLWELRGLGEIPAIQIGRSVRFAIEDLQQFVNSRRQDARQ